MLLCHQQVTRPHKGQDNKKNNYKSIRDLCCPHDLAPLGLLDEGESSAAPVVNRLRAELSDARAVALGVLGLPLGQRVGRLPLGGEENKRLNTSSTSKPGPEVQLHTQRCTSVSCSLPQLNETILLQTLSIHSSRRKKTCGRIRRRAVVK